MTAGEGASLFTLANLMRRYHDCRRRKRSTANALRFETRQELELLALRDALVSRRYGPGRSVCFVVRRPKLREVFAADFRGRIVHHVLVHHLEVRHLVDDVQRLAQGRLLPRMPLVRWMSAAVRRRGEEGSR